MTGKRVLIVGLGIAGIASAVRLSRLGWEVVIVEKAPERRRGGYFIALFGAGVAAAQRLGIAGLVPDRSIPGSINLFVKRNGKRRPGPGYSALPGNCRMMVRGDVEDALYSALGEQADVRYSSTPVALREDAQCVTVDILNQATNEATSERFDLVVGADGLRSTVRRLAFAPENNKTHRLDYMIATFTLDEQVPGFLAKDGIRLAEPGRCVWVFTFADRPNQVMFSYRTDDVDGQFKLKPIDALRRAFGPKDPGPVLGWLLDKFEQTPEHLFDTAEQVKAAKWQQGRVVLVGDAAWCLTLYSGMGASASLAGGDLLGTLLEHYPQDVPRALQAWEEHLRPFINYHMGTGLKQRSFFVPANRKEHIFQQMLLQLKRIPVLGKRIRPGGKMDVVMKTMDIAHVSTQPGAAGTMPQRESTAATGS